jgi:type II restriction/modification system DNA methylase subunit YeeA
MNIPALKAFAPAVRRQLIEAVTLQLNHVLTARTPDYLDTYASQVRALRELAQADRPGLIERVAYTWFNRFTALRFLDARGWHPFGARVLTPATPDETQPELLKLVRSGHCPEELQRHTSLDRLNGLLDGRIPSNDTQGEVYRHLVLAACRFYNELLPDLFERLDDETELLLPDDLLTEHAVAQGFRSEITDEDCAEVEMLGWLYQFYISEKKDQVMARKTAVPTADIPAVTQLFTPHWIVRYLVENSLGRLWLLNRPDSLLRAWMPYYIEGEPETDFLHISRPEDIKVCDPAVGSGHMLTYAFDLLFVIYEEEGYAPSEIPALILRHNLHGLDICPRAAQLAEMALVFKAREKSSRFFQPGNLVQPHVLALRDVYFAENELRGYIEALRLGDLFNEPMLRLLHQFEKATTFGSLIQPCLDEQQTAFARGFIEVKDLGGQLFLHETHKKVLRVLAQAEMLTQRYHVAVANPPYMGPKQMNLAQKEFGKAHFSDAKADIYAMFIKRGFSLVKPQGLSAMVTMQSWMFLQSFDGFRSDLLSTKTILSMAHLGARAFETISGEVVTVTAFCCTNHYISGNKPIFLRLVDGGESDKDQALRQRSRIYRNISQEEFRTIPGSPIAYWISNQVREAFKSELLSSITISDGQNITANNDRFVRNHWEVNRSSTGRDKKWLLYAKGGPFRRWSGNLEFVVDWSPEARVIYRANSSARIIPEYLWYRQGITWSRVGTALAGFRLLPADSTFDKVGSSIFLVREEDIYFSLGLLNSSVAQTILDFLNPSIDIQVVDVRNIPLAKDLDKRLVDHLIDPLVTTAKADWDNLQTSWDFLDQPLLRSGLKGATLEASWRNWQTQSDAAIARMQQLETENNRLFIEAYGLADELTPEVPEEQITLARADARRDMAAFLSYAVGCMVGRHSLDHPGLVLANAGESVPEYLAKVARAQDQLTFAPDEDGIIPVLDGEWFEDDIVARTREFVRATFGEATLRENIRFIEESLGRELRSYFLTDFYKDHLQTYKKRPIYWMIQSPRKGFSVLIYLHRYTRDTMNLVLNSYLREYQIKLRSRIAHLAEVQTSGAVSTRDKTAARKEFDKLTKTLHECEEWERQVVLPLAQARIELDLDDGVKVNYLKLGEALAPIPGLAAAED